MTIPSTQQHGRSATKTATPGGVLLEAREVCKTYKDGERTLEVLRGVDFDLRRGEYVAIIGTSGSGKSTLLHLLGALDRPTSGEITLEGQAYSQFGARKLAGLRATKVGFIYQFHHLLGDFTALENVFMPGMIARRPTPELIERATGMLAEVGLAERIYHRPVKLSGGEQQRVALARALMNDPVVVLADEPTGDLDQKTGQEVMDFVLAQTVEAGRSLVIVTHDPAIAARAHRTFVLEGGRLAPKK